MGGQQYQSWGRYPKVNQQAVSMFWRQESLPLDGFEEKTFLPYGNGRSYGDSCLNDGGVLIDTRPLNRFIHFDAENGILRCEAGVLLNEILHLILPKGWFIPVSPGTQFVTLGGAIANDIHGKNHHTAGTFGCHVNCLELLQSDGTRRLCSLEENPDWFSATIGGLGLTGLITWVEIKLKKVNNPFIDQETIRFSNLKEFFQISADSDSDFEYTVAWVDCLARGDALGRGVFFRGNHAQSGTSKQPSPPRLRFTFPVDPPFSLVNQLSLKAFNFAFYNKQRKKSQKAIVHYAPFFYPLDSIEHWNRMYGPKGFFQYQFVVPHAGGPEATAEILGRIADSGLGSFLAVLKIFGDKKSPGLLSFPRPGITLALDFPNQGKKTFDLMDRLDDVVRSAKGTIYPAKDARMSKENFQVFYPQWQEICPYIDPRFSSSFWRQVS